MFWDDCVSTKARTFSQDLDFNFSRPRLLVKTKVRLSLAQDSCRSKLFDMYHSYTMSHSNAYMINSYQKLLATTCHFSIELIFATVPPASKIIWFHLSAKGSFRSTVFCCREVSAAIGKSASQIWHLFSTAWIKFLWATWVCGLAIEQSWKSKAPEATNSQTLQKYTGNQLWVESRVISTFLKVICMTFRQPV